MKTIHWLGVGLSSVPGIRRLASKDYNLNVWNRTFSKAENSINHVKSSNVNAKKFDLSELEESLKEEDIVISQLSTNMHLTIAKLCLRKKGEKDIKQKMVIGNCFLKF